MAFEEMIKRLKTEGLLDDSGKLTQKGHEYVIDVKKRYVEKTKPFKPTEAAPLVNSLYNQW
jgi:hypothetical protein